MTNIILNPNSDENLAPPHPVPDMAEMHVPFPVTGLRVPCDGGGGALGHPRVWLTLDENTRQVRCPYCSRHYVEDRGNKVDNGS